MDKDVLYQLYVVEGFSLREVAVYLSKSEATIRYWMSKFSIPRRKIGCYLSQKYKVDPSFNKGSRHGMFGRTHSDETKKRLGDMARGRVCSDERRKILQRINKLELHSQWRGGISFQPYPLVFNKELKEKIRARDGYKCVKCGVEESGRKHSIHHIDYDKENCNEENLITLCVVCNSKVNYNREYYERIFKCLVSREGRRYLSSPTEAEDYMRSLSG